MGGELRAPDEAVKQLNCPYAVETHHWLGLWNDNKVLEEGYLNFSPVDNLGENLWDYFTSEVFWVSCDTLRPV